MTGLDLAAKLLEAGRAKAKAEGLEIEWREGMHVTHSRTGPRPGASTFGHMFAPRHQRTAHEMARCAAEEAPL